MDDQVTGPEALRQYLTDNRGEAEALAKYLGVTRGAVSNWWSQRIPAEHVPAISRFCDIPRRVLRPDLYERG